MIWHSVFEKKHRQCLQASIWWYFWKKSAGSAAAAFRFDPNKMAIWLMAGLLDVVDRLYVLSDKGERPSLLPIRRSLQMIIDNMKTFSQVYIKC